MSSFHLKATSLESGEIYPFLPVVLTEIKTRLISINRYVSAPDLASCISVAAINSGLLQPVINYTAIPDQPVRTSLSLPDFAAVSDEMAFASVLPKLYYKKSTNEDVYGGNTSIDNGWKYVTATNTTSPYSFVMDFTRIESGGINPGDIIQYYVSAEDPAKHKAIFSDGVPPVKYPLVQNVDMIETVVSSFIIMTTLPVTLMSFSGSSKPGYNQLQWTTGAEFNNKFFEPERSVNGTDFVSIGRVNGKQNTATNSNYSFDDKDLLKEAYYYRLKQIDFDGKFTVSKTILLSNNLGNFRFSVSPNPMVDKIQLISAINLYNATVTLMDMKGQKLLQKAQVSGKLFSFDVSSFKSGIYLIQVTEGNETTLLKLLKY